MHVYKLSPDDRETKTIEKHGFESATGKKPPWFVEGDDKERQYAVCPACDNPVQIIGLYEPLSHTPNPYGRHTGKKIEGFSYYDPEAFSWCPYVKNNNTGTSKNNRDLNEIALKILGVVLSQFDRIIYILEKETGIQISQKLATNILDHWLTGEGYLYPGANLQNIPWMVAYRTRSLSIFGQKIVDNELLKAAIEKKIDGAIISDDGRITKGSKYYAVNGVFLGHKTKFDDEDNLIETICFEVSTTGSQYIKRNIIYTKTITCDPTFFERLINLSPERAQRKRKLLELAEDVFQEKLPSELFSEAQKRALL